MKRQFLDLDVIFDPDRPAPTGESLRFFSPPDLPAEWLFAWSERAAIMEYDGGLLRERAEVEALKCVLAEMREAGELPPEGILAYNRSS